MNVKDEMRHFMLHAFMYRDASHLWHSCSHNITKINIQFLTHLLVKICDLVATKYYLVVKRWEIVSRNYKIVSHYYKITFHNCEM